MPLAGQLAFELRPKGATSFSVLGKMSGSFDGGPLSGQPFYGTIDGLMSCTALLAKLDMWGAGAAQFKGSLASTFTAGPQHGFSTGTWMVQEVNAPSCKHAGSWNVQH